MPRQSISFTAPNNNWLKAQVKSDEFSSKSEVVNDLIRKARTQKDEIEFIRARLIKSEQSGVSEMSRNDILARSKEAL
jgi:antitoxin ParD1/3/4